MILDENALGSLGKRIKTTFSATFNREKQDDLKKHVSKSIIKNEVGIYIHFPFCKSLCPACPYFREIVSEKKLRTYLSALKKEIKIVGKVMRDKNLKVVSIHAGGGTPSLIDKDWAEIIQTIRENFNVDERCKFGIEANPDDLTEEKVSLLRESGVEEISIGVQSFFRNNLKLLGRVHGVEESLDAIENCKKAGFKLINIDMMYMLPNQTLKDWVHDLKLALEQEVNQITIYPLLVPHYTTFYQLMKEGRIPEQPSIKEFEQMYYAAVDNLAIGGYFPIRYYSFGKGKEEYSTVELEMVGPLIGFGAGAMSFTGGYEYVNTCSVKEYIKATNDEKLPVAGGRIVRKEERAIRYVSERLSALRLNIGDFEREFNEPFEELMRRSGYTSALRMGYIFGTLKRKSNEIIVTRKGMWSRNLTGWAFVLLVPCKIVEEFMKTPWPIEVTIP
ncbi:MAG: coproporphyrinogen-III oxidase family protein [Thermoproteota archaeon]